MNLKTHIQNWIQYKPNPKQLWGYFFLNIRVFILFQHQLPNCFMSLFTTAAEHFKRESHCFQLKSIIITETVMALPCAIP